MSDRDTQIHIGAQTRAAGIIRDRQAEFNTLIDSVSKHHSDLQSGYQGEGAARLSNLVGDWVDSAKTLIKEFDAFAQRMETTDKNTSSSQSDQSGTFARARRDVRTSI